MCGAVLKLFYVFRNEWHKSVVTFPAVARALAVVIPCSSFRFTLNISKVVMISSHNSRAEQYGLKNCLKIWLPDPFWLPKESVPVFYGALLFCLLEIGVRNPCWLFAIMLFNTHWPV